MKRHRISANHEGKKRYKCSICFSDFDKKVSLKHHNIAAHKKKVHKCSRCHERFTFKKHLKKHFSDVHENEKPFKCWICDKAFDQKGSLDKHNAAVHEEKKTLKIKPKNGHSRIKHYSREVKEEGKWPQRRYPKGCPVFSRIFYCLTCDKECCLERDFDKDEKQALKSTQMFKMY